MAMETAKTVLYSPQLYPEMEYVTGVEPKDGTYEDFQREFRCKNLHRADCKDKGLQFPRKCSHPPCDLSIANYQG